MPEGPNMSGEGVDLENFEGIEGLAAAYTEIARRERERFIKNWEWQIADHEQKLTTGDPREKMLAKERIPQLKKELEELRTDPIVPKFEQSPGDLKPQRLAELNVNAERFSEAAVRVFEELKASNDAVEVELDYEERFGDTCEMV